LKLIVLLGGMILESSYYRAHYSLSHVGAVTPCQEI
jgi:hypothetical protein